MALIEYKIGENGIETIDKEKIAIQRLQSFEPEEGYYLAFSGGKDSIVLKKLAQLSGVKYDAHYSVTSVDPPELIQYIKKYHPDVIFERQYWDYEKTQPITMWNLIPRKLMPPTRLARYCCAFFKETGGTGRVTLTGVRWAESVRRKNQRNLAEILAPKKENNILFSSDNEEAKQMVESCYKRSKTIVNPIIDWEDQDIWEFIKKYNLPYCELYDQGFHRLGCIGCPMNPETASRDFKRYPKYKEMYLRTFDKMLKERKEKGLPTHKCWETAENVMRWWLEETPKHDEQQMSIFEADGIEDIDEFTQGETF